MYHLFLSFLNIKSFQQQNYLLFIKYKIGTIAYISWIGCKDRFMDLKPVATVTK